MKLKSYYWNKGRTPLRHTYKMDRCPFSTHTHNSDPCKSASSRSAMQVSVLAMVMLAIFTAVCTGVPIDVEPRGGPISDFPKKNLLVRGGPISDFPGHIH